MKLLRYCNTCGKYTMDEECCGENTKSAHPPKFSITDPYGEYRRKAKNIIKE